MSADRTFGKFNRLNQQYRVEHDARFGLDSSDQVDVKDPNEYSEDERSGNHAGQAEVQIQFAEQSGGRVGIAAPSHVTLKQLPEGKGKGNRLARPYGARHEPVQHLGQRRAQQKMPA